MTGATVGPVSKEQQGRTSLLLDAAYCAGVGTTLVGLARPVGDKLGIPTPLVAAAGIGAVGWSAFVARSATHKDWRRSVAIIAAANAAGAVGLMVLASRQPKFAAKATVGVTALEVAGFAASQVLALVGKDSEPAAA